MKQTNKDKFVELLSKWNKKKGQKAKEYLEIISFLDQLINSVKEAERERCAKDMKFLIERVEMAGTCPFGVKRDVGVSSNAIVKLAYGGRLPCTNELPSDESDLMACENMWKKLPKHRKSKEVIQSMENARNFKVLRKE